jgi:DNA topoisomerase IB
LAREKEPFFFSENFAGALSYHLRRRRNNTKTVLLHNEKTRKRNNTKILLLHNEKIRVHNTRAIGPVGMN